MSQRHSGYPRRPMEHYSSPRWVTEALMRNLDLSGGVWECAAGEGAMAEVLDADFRSDIRPLDGLDWIGDFLEANNAADCLNIVTNPPFGEGGKLAVRFIEHALRLTEAGKGKVAMLLRVDFDSAKTRKHLFADNPAWSQKLILTDRIKWFDGPAGPSDNHAWFIFSHQHKGPPTIKYAGKGE